jgi:hypothetical protein
MIHECKLYTLGPSSHPDRRMVRNNVRMKNLDTAQRNHANACWSNQECHCDTASQAWHGICEPYAAWSTIIVS